MNRFFFSVQLNSAELYDPSTKSWTPIANMKYARKWHQASVLDNGKVLVTGGLTNSAELYDPSTKSWTATGTMHYPRAGHTASVLANGKVLVAGASLGDTCMTGASPGDTCMTSAELYDSETGNWTITGSLNNGRTGHAASVLINGSVLVCGGRAYMFYYMSSSEVYDPLTKIWYMTGDMNYKRYQHQSSVLPNGTVLVTGTEEQGLPTSSAELY
ncbi:unnamed protein product [Adineta steineri]|uniref:Uncharacterized protein n=1 Tax=Adineta steineri TaxID=433720 RepID=A0A815CFT2_9BILA|nr:unnamed protein product [Adineta steineri]